MRDASPYPRIAITGMALCNALGCHTEKVWQKTLAMHSGVRRLTQLPDDPPGFFDPPFVPGVNSYCDVAALCNLNFSRHDLGLPPHDFAAMSASSRLTLYLARATITASKLADAGYDPQRVGVFVSQNAGESASTLWDLNVSLRADWIARAAAEHGHWDADTQRAFRNALRQGRKAPDESTLLCRLNCTVAGLVCRQFGFAGPSFSVGAACSSSMAAIFVALHLLRDGTIDAAVVGGGEEMYAPLYMAEFCALGALARASETATQPELYSRPFDTHRNGFVLGEGAAMLVLEREDTARKRSAPLHGLITGAGHITNTLGLIEPSAEAQQQAMRLSFEGLDYGPAQVQLIECHATGTLQGDLEEGRALAHTYADTGAVLTAYKGQIGHTTGASGATALIHGLLSMRDGLYPGTVNCPEPDPAIPILSAGLRLPSQPETWPRPTAPGTDGIRRMQVNSFAFGGACFALQVEEPNERCHSRQGVCACGGLNRKETGQETGQDYEQQSIQETVIDGVRLVNLTHPTPPTPPAHGGREWRLGSTAPAWIQEIAGLPNQPTTENLNALARRGIYLHPADAPPPIAVMCCGQGSVWPGMGRALYDTFAPARAAMDRIAAVASWDVLALMDETDMEKIVRTRWQQPYLFLLEFAQASYLQSLGFTPTVMSGHSLGELIALCLAGVYTPETGWNMIETRAQQMSKLEDEATKDTGMLAVYGAWSAVEEAMTTFPGLHISNYNTPTQYILSGPRDILTEARRSLRKNKIPAILLNVSLAFHHPNMRVMREDSLRAIDRIAVEVTGKTMQAPRLPMMSCVTAGLYPHEHANIATYIADLDESAVNWVNCVRAMWNTHGVRHFVELGPTDTLCGLTGDIEPQAVCISAARKDKEVEGMRAAVAQLYALGHLPRPTGIPTPLATSFPRRRESNQDILDTHEVETRRAVSSPESLPLYIEEVFPLIIEATGYERQELTPDMDLRHDLAIRSSRFPIIIQAAERRFDISVRFEDLMGVATIRDLAEALNRLRKKSASPTTDSKPSGADTPAGPPSLRRLLPGTMPFVETSEDLRKDNWIPAFAGMTKKRQLSSCQNPTPLPLPLLLVGHGVTTEAWKAHTTHQATHQTSNPAEALALLHTLPQAPQTLILALPPQTDEPTQILTDCLLLLQAFLGCKDARFCLALTKHNEHDEEIRTDVYPKPTPPATSFPRKRESSQSILGDTHDNEYNSVFEGLTAMLSSLAMEYPSCTFRAISTQNVSHETFWESLTQTNTPLQWRVHADGTVHTPVLRPALHDPAEMPHALGLRPNDVIVVSGGAGGITPATLEWLAPLGCTFALLGRSPGPPMPERFTRLTEQGATVHYYQCDITDTTSVDSTLASIAAAHGRIDGILHAAGLNRDATLAALTPEDMHAVLAVKCYGLDALLHAAHSRGLRYAVAFGSLAAWLGNYGQSHYSAANRAMAAQLHAFCAARNLPSRCIWLPPIVGAGMADSEDMREHLRQRGLEHACMDISELAPMLAHELCACAGRDVLWARHIPVIPVVTGPHPVLEPENGTKNMVERPHIYPLIYPIALEYGAQWVFTGGHHLSHYADTCLADAPRIDGEAAAPTPLLLACLTESAVQSLPWLVPMGMEKIRLLAPVVCPQGVTREVRTHTTIVSHETMAETILEVRTITANGRRTDTWAQAASATVLLTAAPVSLAPLWDKASNTHEPIHGYIFTQKEIAVLCNTRYAWPVTWLDALLPLLAQYDKHGVDDTDTRDKGPLLASVERILCTGTSPHEGQIVVEIRETPSTDASLRTSIDIQVRHEDGTVFALITKIARLY